MRCIFCEIAKGEIPAKVLYEDENVMVFEDMNKVAPFHALLIPKVHIENVMKISKEELHLVADIHWIAKKLAEQHQLTSYRLVTNAGEMAGQTVFHLHVHMIAGKPLHGLIAET